MRILIVGGTSFVGRAVALAAWRAGHSVTVINRGVTPTDLPDGIERLEGDRTSDLSALAGRSFDATVDSSGYRPADVTRLAAALDGRAGHYLQVSSISAYANPEHVDATEAELELHDEAGLDLDGPITAETYGPLKAAAERVAPLVSDRVTIVRPTYVIGAHDATLRFPYWVERARRGGVVAVPGPRDSALQYIDARDLADFMMAQLLTGATGAVHVCGPSPAPTYAETIERVVAHVGPPGTSVRVVEPERVLAAGLEGRFPLWSGPTSEAALALSNELALSRGLVLRPVEESVDDVVSWWDEREWPGHWLRADAEEQLLAS